MDGTWMCVKVTLGRKYTFRLAGKLKTFVLALYGTCYRDEIGGESQQDHDNLVQKVQNKPVCIILLARPTVRRTVTGNGYTTVGFLKITEGVSSAK